MSKLQGHTCSVVCVAFHPSALVLATGSQDNTAKLWRLTRNGLAATCAATLHHDDWVSCVSFHPCGTILATCCLDNSAMLWQLGPDGTGAVCAAVLTGHSGPVWSSAFHPFLPVIATCSSDKSVKFWRLFSEEVFADPMGECCGCYATLQEQEQCHDDCINALAFHNDGLLMATCSSDHTAKLWLADADFGRATDDAVLLNYFPRFFATLSGHTARVTSVAFHPHALMIATGSEDLTARMWSIDLSSNDAACVAVFAGHSDRVTSVAFCRNAPLLVTGTIGRNDSSVVWLLNTAFPEGTRAATVAGHERSPLKSLCGVRAIAFHPSAPVFVTGSEDNTATLWQ
jgi:hypothetical protein